jgi:hypothetical protein
MRTKAESGLSIPSIFFPENFSISPMAVRRQCLASHNISGINARGGMRSGLLKY